MLELATALLLDSAGKLILVRKRGTKFFMQPGGKIESNESPEEALIRELFEELSILVDLDNLYYLGVFENVAANEPNIMIRAHMFHVVLDIDLHAIQPSAEIEEVLHLSCDFTISADIAPLTREQVLPLWFKLIERS